jgi:hypothetical protein
MEVRVEDGRLVGESYGRRCELDPAFGYIDATSAVAR